MYSLLYYTLFRNIRIMLRPTAVATSGRIFWSAMTSHALSVIVFPFCSQCSLACHKKCLETLAIQCGHKKLHGKLHLFGIDFTQVAKNSPDGIPFIIKKCISEIENRALNIKVASHSLMICRPNVRICRSGSKWHTEKS